MIMAGWLVSGIKLREYVAAMKKSVTLQTLHHFSVFALQIEVRHVLHYLLRFKESICLYMTLKMYHQRRLIGRLGISDGAMYKMHHDIAR